MTECARATSPNPAFWNGRRVFLTGHTGFKGAWLAFWLRSLGVKLVGFSLPPEPGPNLFSALFPHAAEVGSFGDIRDAAMTRQAMAAAAPEIVLHLAAQSLVRRSYDAPLETLATNVMGTAHVLEAARAVGSVRAVIVVSSDKCYENREWLYPYREDDALGGHDPYSASKAAAEIVAASYRDAFLREQGVALATARAGNVIGGGDWSADRLIPDAIRAWQTGASLTIRRPHAVRPWQHAMEPLAAYLALAQALWHDPAKAGAYNFGPASGDSATVGEVATLASRAFGGGNWHCPDADSGPHEAGLLGLEVAHARTALGVVPRWTLEEAVARTMRWYRAHADGADAGALCGDDMAAYVAGTPIPVAAKLLRAA